MELPDQASLLKGERSPIVFQDREAIRFLVQCKDIDWIGMEKREQGSDESFGVGAG